MLTYLEVNTKVGASGLSGLGHVLRFLSVTTHNAASQNEPELVSSQGMARNLRDSEFPFKISTPYLTDVSTEKEESTASIDSLHDPKF